MGALLVSTLLQQVQAVPNGAAFFLIKTKPLNQVVWHVLSCNLVRLAYCRLLGWWGTTSSWMAILTHDL